MPHFTPLKYFDALTLGTGRRIPVPETLLPARLKRKLVRDIRQADG
jgi:hypothetical protein